MPDLYPLLLKPFFSPRPWGTRDLSPIYAQAPGTEPVGEAWLTGDQCEIANGPLAGTTLIDVCKKFGRELVGETAPEEHRYPLLVKFLFPNDKLSVQVHPDDAGAQAIGQPVGKTECWYVLKANAGAQVGLGLKSGITRQEFERAIHENRAEDLMNWIDVHDGELIFVDAGTVHAIGPGSILVETQQNSDTTFRLYDYGRPRELHIQQGLAATKEVTNAGKVRPEEMSDRTRLIATPYFLVEKFRLEQKETLAFSMGDPSSAQVLTAIDGFGVVEADDCEPVTFGRGDAVIVPASLRQIRIRPQWELQFLRSMVPASKVSTQEITPVLATST